MSTTIFFNVETSHDGQTWQRLAFADFDINCSGWRVLLTGKGAEQPFPAMAHMGYPANMDPATKALQVDLAGEFGNDRPFWFTLADVDRVLEGTEDFTMARYDYDVALTLDAAEPVLSAARDHARNEGLTPHQVRVIAVLS